ncbi:MAG TPA: ABC transporter ATP-binding protein [Candidatus Limnocylindria bacterium]|nr:ABC transporter ATP-binding protein [Candidatus Limnocylindria bacterium]
MSALLEVQALAAGYGGVPVLHDVSLTVAAEAITVVVGANGAGKTTLLRAISGIVRPSAGSVRVNGTAVERRRAHDIVRLGIAHVPEGRRIFARLTVAENLRLGGYIVGDRQTFERTKARVVELFPILRDRETQRAGTLSGGEQQMLAIGRALMSAPQLLLLDEPTLGIAPLLVAKLFDAIKRLPALGTAVLLVEQNVREALEIAASAYVLQTGRVVLTGQGRELLGSDLVRQAYLGL